MIVFKVERAKFYNLLDDLMACVERVSDGDVLEVNFGSGDSVLFMIYDDESEEKEND